MRFLYLMLFFLMWGGQSYGKERQKRFLRSGFLNPLSERLTGLGDFARDLSEQISSQASMAVQSFAPQAAQAVSELSSLGRQVGETVRQGLQKRGLTRASSIERETEDDDTTDEKDVETTNNRPFVGNKHGPNRPGIGFFGFGLFRPWWQGPNICEEESVVEEPNPDTDDTDIGFKFNFITTSCVPTHTAYICTKETKSESSSTTVITKKQCCPGFIRRTDGRPGCAALRMETLKETLKELEMTKFLSWIENTDLEEKFQDLNLTVFAPSNEAIVDFEDEADDNEISAINPVRRYVDSTSIVPGHVAEGFNNVDAMEPEHLLDTLDNESKIRINRYKVSNEIMTANCVPVTGKNNYAKNGIVHLVSGILPRPKSTLAEILENGKEYETFKKLLESNGLMEDLKKEDKPWTLFVPTNEAFKQLPKSLRKQIEAGNGCTLAILEQHMSRGTVCSAAVISQSGVRNTLDNLLRLTRDEADRLRVDGAKVTSKDVLGTNGVIHVIDEVLIPPQARDLLKTLEEQDRTDLLKLVELAEMRPELESSSNITFFLPSKDALKNLSNETQEQLANDPEFVKTFLKHHLIQSHAPSSEFSNNKKLTTLNGHSVHLNMHEVFPGLAAAVTVQCAFIVRQDEKACGAIIHKINKVIMPPKGTIVETLKSMKNHDIVMKLLQLTDLETRLAEKGPYTFLAPTDEAFERMDDSTLKNLMENSTMAEDVLKYHILPEVLCCNSVNPASPFHRQFVRTLNGGILPTYRGLSIDRVRFGRARVTQCDVPATNGLVHSINRVILPERPTTPIFRVNLFPLV